MIWPQLKIWQSFAQSINQIWNFRFFLFLHFCLRFTNHRNWIFITNGSQSFCFFFRSKNWIHRREKNEKSGSLNKRQQKLPLDSILFHSHIFYMALCPIPEFEREGGGWQNLPLLPFIKFFYCWNCSHSYEQKCMWTGRNRVCTGQLYWLANKTPMVECVTQIARKKKLIMGLSIII